ncbi:MAG: hypothetical protein ABR923_03905 [Terracidiphilus sp.]|jgi:hypothetical protein
MFEVGQKVIVITDKGISYDAVILATAQGDDGSKAYKVTMNGLASDQSGQWHKSSEIFIPDKTSTDEEALALDNFLKL